MCRSSSTDTRSQYATSSFTVSSDGPDASSQSLLDDIHAFRIPTDFIELFDAAKVPYYDGAHLFNVVAQHDVYAS